MKPLVFLYQHFFVYLSTISWKNQFLSSRWFFSTLSVHVARVRAAGAQEGGPNGAPVKACGGGLPDQPGNQEVTLKLNERPLVHH